MRSSFSRTAERQEEPGETRCLSGLLAVYGAEKAVLPRVSRAGERWIGRSGVPKAKVPH